MSVMTSVGGMAPLVLMPGSGSELYRGLGAIVLIVVMATGAAIGSPGTPGVGIVILATILSSVGIPPAGVAIILGVDRLLDMCRTAINVSGDMVACLVVDASHEDGEADAKPETAPS